MPGVASLLNKAIPNEQGIQLFYNTLELNLGLRLMDGKAKPSDDNNDFHASSTARKGIIVNPSAVAAAEFLGTNIVVALTQPVLPNNQSDYTEYDVSIVSPVYQPLASTYKDNKSIAISSSGKSAWVTFIQGKDANSLSLGEYSIDNVNTNTFTGTTKILFNSELAAYYDFSSSKRYVIYQSASGNTLYEYDVNSQTPIHISNSNNAKPLTPIAVTLVGQNAYLYYLDNSNDVCRIVKNDGVWGTSSVLSVPTCDPDSDLTVITANSTNHLFYLPSGAGSYKFTHKTDTLVGA